MAYDEKIRKYFEIADDGMQGVIGYYHYVDVCKKLSNKDKIIDELPSTIRITFHWVRNYDPQNLSDVMGKLFSLYHSRMCIINVISIFEGALGNFISRLVELSIMTDSIKGYKKRLQWAFDLVKNSVMGNEEDLQRIPDICLNVDHARRIRNLWMHNNGVINSFYETDGIVVQGKNPIIFPEYNNFMSNQRDIAIILGPDSFELFYISHIELLHHLHDTIQRYYFGDTEGYNYAELFKAIEWHRALTGQ